MAIPTQAEAYRITLGLMLDGEQRTPKQIKEKALDVLHLTSEELQESTSSGVPLWDSRIGWAIQFLQRAFLLTRVSRGLYVIADEGKRVYESGIDGLDFSRALDTWIRERNPWNTGADSKKQGDEGSLSNNEDLSPEERIDKLYDELKRSLSNELLDLIMDRDPVFFEQLVVDLLEKMGYGKGEATPYVGDSGIDGIITTDSLGFDPIFIQAKRYASDHKVGRPEIQAFAGALNSVTRGAFITTSSFSNDAKDYAKSFSHATIILIDGARLTELMIKYDLGVTSTTPRRSYEIKRVDVDYFEEM